MRWTCVCVFLMASCAAMAAPKPRKFNFGVRFTGYPLNVIPDATMEQSSTDPAVNWTFTTSSEASRAGIGPSIEMAIGRRLSVSADLIFHGANYQQVTDIVQGTDNSSTTEDERQYTTIIERTKASFWDIPVMLRYNGLQSESWLSKVCVSGGASLRMARNIRTTIDTVHPDDSTSGAVGGTPPAVRNLAGAVLGVGFRYIDDYNFKLTPEVRYTRWFGLSFDSSTTRSRKDQIEVTVAITF